MGLTDAIVRVYEVAPKPQVATPEAFEQSMAEQIFPTLRLHYGNRLGHTTDTQLLLKVERGPLPLNSGYRYQWWISRRYYEPFEPRDSFLAEVENTLDTFKSVGDLHGFSDYRILAFADLQQE